MCRLPGGSAANVMKGLANTSSGAVHLNQTSTTRLAAVLLLMFGICRVPGGSAANVMKGLANISAGSVHCSFMGMVGTDAVATDYMAKLKQQNVHPVLLVRLWNCPKTR
jgi:sugar/nucleoside kinase (ribokinase family)